MGGLQPCFKTFVSQVRRKRARRKEDASISKWEKENEPAWELDRKRKRGTEKKREREREIERENSKSRDREGMLKR